MEILKATIEEAGEIALLNDAVQRMHFERYPNIFKYPLDRSEMEKFWRERLSEADNFAFIARVSGQAVGYVLSAIQRRPESALQHAQETMYIQEIYIEPANRRQGIGRELMQAVEDVAAGHGIGRFSLVSWEFNKDAHAFFERLGFCRACRVMWRE